VIFFIGFIVGFLAAIPIGPLNIYAVSQTLKHNVLHGLLIGLTSSLLDIIYCFIALTGMTQISSFLIRLEYPFKLIGAGILIFISIRLITKRESFEHPRPFKGSSLAYSRPVAVSFFLYASNPTLYAFWLGVASILAAHRWLKPGLWQPAVFALFCGIGSIVWYFILVKYVSKYRHFFTPKVLGRIIIGLAILLIGFAAFSLVSLFL
jgi:threonine/homoserine/homoserine lactone efflux protein